MSQAKIDDLMSELWVGGSGQDGRLGGSLGRLQQNTSEEEYQASMSIVLSPLRERVYSESLHSLPASLVAQSCLEGA